MPSKQHSLSPKFCLPSSLMRHGFWRRSRLDCSPCAQVLVDVPPPQPRIHAPVKTCQLPNECQARWVNTRARVIYIAARNRILRVQSGECGTQKRWVVSGWLAVASQPELGGGAHRSFLAATCLCLCRSIDCSACTARQSIC